MKGLLVSTLFCLFTCIINTNINAQIKAPKFGKGIQVIGADSTYYLKIGFRFQNLVAANWALANETEGYIADYNSNALVRRSRLKFDGWAVSPKLKYKLELSLSNRDNGGGGNLNEFGNAANIILDAIISWNFVDNLSIRFGQSKLAGNRERVISSSSLQFVDRSRLNSRFNIDRDVFIQLAYNHNIGDEFFLRESVSIANGEGKNQIIGYNDGYDFTFRIEALPFGKFSSKGDYVGSAIKRESSPKLAFGLTYDNNNNAIRERGQLGSFITNANGDYIGKNLNTFIADMMFKYEGISIMAEYADKATADDVPFVFDENDALIGQYYTGSAFNIALGYMFKNHYELAVRYTDVTADTATDETHYTFGLNKFIVGHSLKVQTDVSFIERTVAQNFLLWRTQVEIHF